MQEAECCHCGHHFEATPDPRAHKLLCGDSTSAEDMGRLLAGEKAAMVFCDPPYNVNYGASMKDKIRGNRRTILNDNLGDDFPEFLRAVCSNILRVTDGAVYICMSSSELHTLQRAFQEAGGHWSTFLIWAKNTFTIGRADYQRQYEPILYGWREGGKHHWCGDRDQGDVWNIAKPTDSELHPTQKPLELVERALRNSSQSNDIVLDAFLGSGTTMVAAEQTGRICYAMEIAPAYVAVALERMSGMGLEPRLLL